MKRKMLLGVTASACIAMLTAISVLPGGNIPKKVNAAADPVFNQQVNIKNNSNEDDVDGVAIPQLTISYSLTPNTGLADSSNSMYETDTTKYPILTIDTDSRSNFYYNHTINAQALTGGTLTDSIHLSDFFGTDATGTNVTFDNFKPSAKYYTYDLTMTGIYEGTVGAKNDAPTNGTNLIDGTSLISQVESSQRTIGCVIRTDASGAIAQAIYTFGDGKVSGFVDNTAETNREAGYSAINADVEYNVYNVNLSQDYIGGSAPSYSFSMEFSNLPNYLDNSTSTSLLKLPTGWTITNAALGDGNITVSGSLASGSEIKFIGLPYDDTVTSQIKYEGTLNYSGLSDAPNYDNTMYAGAGAPRITSAETSLTAFNTFNFSKGNPYKNETITPATSIKTSSTLNNTTDADTSNNIRFVAIDPNEFVLVGVVVDYAPGLVMIGFACLAGFAMFRRNRNGRR